MKVLYVDTMRILWIGVGATAVMDMWLWLLKRLNIPTLNFALLGRWVGHWRYGKWHHDSIAKSASLRSELAMGWLAHYLIGVGFAGLLVLLFGLEWVRSPRLLPAILVGGGTVIAPLFLMQPAMGAGFASMKTLTPFRNCLRSLANHTVFGIGLYLAARLVVWISQC